MKDGKISATDRAYDAKRRAFLRTITAATTAVLATGACSSAVSPKAIDAGSANQAAANLPPVWQTVPSITFTQGVASSVSIAGYVSDPNGDSLTIALQPNDPALPAGVTYDAAGKRFVYDGVGAVGSTNGHILTADDGRP